MQPAISPTISRSPVLAPAESIPADQVLRLALAPLTDWVFEAEDWGERPELGLSVQDMSGWGSEWSRDRQIFWNPQPPAYVFKWDFSVSAARYLRINLTAAPDYAPLTIRLGCYRQTAANYYQLLSEHVMYHDGYATSVRRQSVGFPIVVDPKCKTADMYRLLFVAKPSEGRTFGGIDNIVVQH
ncbi:hypothetical protein GCM10011515_05450 [Tsuneonella deserti]|uniref:Uncharacterized protein n=1 Tax=Tsuneonella deserti TaxID=2035528 RepID=A0ABQ1S2Z3_9SPHN|nr:hypothetical protein [Tsuneonella deserti]GGD88688.1 hypothetical protein GCM10011515_05450 [Tsuneonella deserti]